MITSRIITLVACMLSHDISPLPRLMATAFASPQHATTASRTSSVSRRWASLPFGTHYDSPLDSGDHTSTLASCTATTLVTDHSSATIALALSAMALCVITVAWIAYHEGRRRGGDQPGTSHDDLTESKKKTGKSSGNVPRTYSNSEISDNAETSSSSHSPYASSLSIDPIGTLHSIYRLCVGTPRQGMLAPHSRGVVTFDETKVSKDSILELQNYSHVFVVFVFHLNSNGKVLNGNGDKSNNGGGGNTNGGKNSKPKNQKGQFTSKIAPPSLGGKKVGIFSTRTPHRPNPIGFSLCKLDEVIVHDKKRRKQIKQQQKQGGGGGGGGTFSLLLSGLDIVDGTPILDVKPYVPHYDCVGYSSPLATSVTNAVRVPHWVDSGLQKRRHVTFLPAANQFLEGLSRQNTDQSTSSSISSLKQLQFYGPHSPWKDSPDDSVKNLKACILELLGVDVRSAWQTKKARKGKFQAERSSRLKEWKGSDRSDDTNATTGSSVRGANDDSANVSGLCTQQIDNLLVQYTIEEPGSALYSESAGSESPVVDERSMGSGAEDIVVVHAISLIGQKRHN